MMKELGVQCIITLGGDGTNRMVAKACGDTPMLPISTGTNNVFPFTVEATVAGMVAGMISEGSLDESEAIRRRKRLEVIKAEEVMDIALIDAVVTRESAVGARAIWDVGRISQIVQTCGTLSGIGLSSIGACFHHVSSSDNFGISVEIGNGGRRVLAPIAPGLIKEVQVRSTRIIDIGERVPVRSAPVVVALDGERELKLRCCEDIFFRLSELGPRVVDVYTALRLATEKGLLRINK
jgi:predicted polyphosphate/ATP-dependent NAD kinase